jgi:hypothetical protein
VGQPEEADTPGPAARQCQVRKSGAVMAEHKQYTATQPANHQGGTAAVHIATSMRCHKQAAQPLILHVMCPAHASTHHCQPASCLCYVTPHRIMRKAAAESLNAALSAEPARTPSRDTGDSSSSDSNTSTTKPPGPPSPPSSSSSSSGPSPSA